jgi:DNA-binding protein HU-beta
VQGHGFSQFLKNHFRFFGIKTLQPREKYVRLKKAMQRPALSRALLYQKKYKRSSPMNKSELINAVAEKAALSKKDSEAAVTAALDAITAALAEGDEVRLVGFGTFEVKKREARIGRNPKTKEEIQIPATKIPSFKPGKALKDVVAK